MKQITSPLLQSLIILLQENQINGWTSKQIWNKLSLSTEQKQIINQQELYRILRGLVKQGHLIKNINSDNSRLSTFIETESMDSFRKQFKNHLVKHDSEKLRLKTKELQEKQKICENQIKASEQAFKDFPELKNEILRRKNQILQDIEKIKAYIDFLTSLISSEKL